MAAKFVLSPDTLYASGFTDLVSVIPPNAQLAPTSKVSGAQLGKVPGHRLRSGLWVGTSGWQQGTTSAEDVTRWTLDGASIGLRAARFPGVDIDCMEPGLSKIIEGAALQKLGPAPIRIGRFPKRLLMYRTTDPFARMKMTIKVKEESHLVEILGAGQQYLVYGTHPITLKSYQWSQEIVNPSELSVITREDADLFFTYLEELFDVLGIGTVQRQGDGRVRVRGESMEQDHLLAPTIDALREAVALLPNTNDSHPDRDDYLKVGYAIRAAAGEDNEADAFQIFAEWAAKWEGNGRSRGNDPEVVLADWRRFHPPFAVGWSYLAEQARPHGFNDAALEFDTEEPERDPEPTAPLFSDQWLAEKVVERRKAELRYVPRRDEFLVWDRARWQPDAVMLAESIIVDELKRIADGVMRMGATDKERKEHEGIAIQICSSGKATAVRTLLQSDRSIAISSDALDSDPWVINTPNGILDLKTGKVLPPDPDQLCTRSTAAPVNMGGECPEWRRYLKEATGGDAELEGYLQRLAGYCLTGLTYEQHFSFLYGPGGRGKGTYINTIGALLGDYSVEAPMDTFTEAPFEKHSTDIAMLQGARLVTASETQAGKRWAEAKVKRMTGGDRITARRMREDNVVFDPQFKLVFSGNHKPEIREPDEAMRRRIHLVPFDQIPAVSDNRLKEKLREEWPAILAWMVEGCLAWQERGLAPPPRIVYETDRYFEDEDAIGRWIKECCEPRDGAEATTQELFRSWVEWANENKEYVGNMRRFVSALTSRGYERWRHPATRRMGFKGLVVRPTEMDLVA